MNLHIGLARAFMIERGWRWGLWLPMPRSIGPAMTSLERKARRLAAAEWDKVRKRVWYRAHHDQERARQAVYRAARRAERIIAHGA